MRVALIAPFYDRASAGESWSTYKWVEGISRRCETVVLTQHPRGWDPAGSPVDAAELVNWVDPELPGMKGRLASELKPTYVSFYLRARQWLRTAAKRGEHFDLVHQINPLALRYPSPARGLAYQYIVGPLAGSLSTPAPFAAVAKEKQWYRKLRHLDSLRLKYDPWLNGSYHHAAAVIGVAPYVAELLKPCKIRRFEIMAETGVDQVSSEPKPVPAPGAPLRALFVGRLIRTKGVLEAIQSVAIASRSCNVTLDIVGVGELFDDCQELVNRLDLGSRVRLHGRLPKEEVFKWYERSDVFLFPSYREPSGNVVFEAMSRGLPVIGSAVGGPGYVVTDESGYRIPTETRMGFVNGLSDALIELTRAPEKVASMSAAALRRISDLAIWPNKIDRMLTLYSSLSAAERIEELRHVRSDSAAPVAVTSRGDQVGIERDHAAPAVHEPSI
jgi:glycosyltransferase involved in cell wall biosynthesis